MDRLAFPPHRRLRLPRPLTPFVGRERELADLERRLADPACRVLTLIGPGGFGKTRLALQLGAGWPEDVLYVDLQARPGPRPLAADIADAGRHPPPAGVTLEEHLLQDLRERRCLVVLDGFERLLDHHPAAEPFAFLERLLEAAPGVKLLVASREALSLLGEWRYPVSGLASPPPDMDPRQPAAMEFEAVRLFVQAAQRVRPDFSPEDEAAGIIRLCQLVEGMPLALELAAAWTTTLTCAAIADEIAGGAELGHAGLRNLPAQHHSVQAVFRQAWERLAPEEQQVFRRLAVFRPGFSPAAAAAVAEATRPRLGALLDKALLRRDAQGRYALHELLRQFAEERLAEAAETDRFQARHAEYYAECLRQWRADLKGGRQAEAVRRIAAEIANIRAAWDWLVEQAEPAAIQKAADTLRYYFQIQSRYREGAEAFERAARRLAHPGPAGPARAEVLIYQGWFCIRLGQFEQARAVLEESRSILKTLGLPALPGAGRDPLNALGTLANTRGDYAGAWQLGEAARQAHLANHDEGNLMDAHYVLTNAALARGEYETARHHAQQAYALAAAAQDRWMMAYILNDLGSVARAIGDYALARQHFQASYELRRALDDPEGMAVALSHLGRVARLHRDYAAAQALYARSCALYRELHDRGGLAGALLGGGEAALQAGALDAARPALRQALHTAAEIKWWPLGLAGLVAVAELWRRTGAADQAAPALTLVARHPGTDRETREAAVSGLVELMETLPAGRLAALQAGVPEEPDDLALEQAVTAALAALDVTPPASAPPGQPAADLPEPVTEREREVLRLVAAGLKNQEIADRLVITRGTVRIHLNHLYRKLDVANRVQALARARELGLL